MTQYEAITPDILDELKAISGHRVIVGEEINPDYTHDDMPIYGLAMPEVTIDVTSTDEVSAFLNVFARYQFPGTGCGAGAGLVGCCTPG